LHRPLQLPFSNRAEPLTKDIGAGAGAIDRCVEVDAAIDFDMILQLPLLPPGAGC